MTFFYSCNLYYFKYALFYFSSFFQIIIKGDETSRTKGKKNELSQAILNLINNAKEAFIKRKIQNGVINISITENEICIEDNARGVDTKIREKLFENYVSTKTSGGGIGLSMSKLIIQKHFGAKLLYTPVEKGSLFCICFTPQEKKKN
ncbi:MAG: ATP-binding protein [Campylobacterales bacterium]|nr:ATP-binding protein [Campylobacterales bacterium]